MSTRRNWSILTLAVMVSVLFLAGSKSFGVSDMRVTGYYWQLQTEELPISEIRYQDLTHIIYNAEQAVTEDSEFSPGETDKEDLAELVKTAHKHGVKVTAAHITTSSVTSSPQPDKPDKIPRIQSRSVNDF